MGFHDNVAQKVGTGTSATTLKSWCQTLVKNTNYRNLDRMLYLTNHDDGNDGKNYFSDFGNNVPLMTVLEFTLYGMPLLYNGQEIGYMPIQDYFRKSVIDWNSVNVKIKNTIRVLVALRHTQAALGGGVEANRPAIRFLSPDVNTVLAYEKKKGDNTVLVILNLGTSAVNVTIPDVEEGAYNQVLCSETVSTDVSTITEVVLSATAPVNIGAKGHLVLIKK